MQDSINKEDIAIRPFRLTHIPRFAQARNEIEREAEHLVAKGGERKETSLHLLARILLHRGRMRTFLAWDKQHVIGHVSLVFAKFKKLRGNVYLTIALREAYRGKGIGSRLMETAETYAKTRGIRRVELEVFSKNTHAVYLYKKRGYILEGTKRRAVQQDDSTFDDVLVMSKFLAFILIFDISATLFL